MIEVLGAIKAFIELMQALGVCWKKMLAGCIQPAVTAAMIAALYIGVVSYREGSIRQGILVSVLHEDPSKAERERDMRAAIMQAELRQTVVSDGLISREMNTLLSQIPGAVRARLATIHNGVAGLTGNNLLKFDITHATAADGRSAGELVVNEPLSGLSDWMPAFMRGDCQIRTVASADHTGRPRLGHAGVVGVIGCPVSTSQGEVIGALFIQWDSRETIPTGDALADAIAMTKRSASQLAFAQQVIAK